MDRPSTNSSNPPASHAEDRIPDFTLERYKYILQQLHTLNENNHKFLTLFQTLVTAIIVGEVSILVSWKKLDINSEMARLGAKALLGLLLGLTLFVVFSIVAGVFSWFDYRKEEVELLGRIGASEIRAPPKLSNFWRWYETYIVIFLLCVVAIIYWLIEKYLIPLIQ